MQHVRELPNPQKVSGRVPPDLTYTWEPLSAALKDFARLLARLIQEVGHNHEQSPFDPNWDQYLALELAGIGRFLAVRDGRKLVGFALCTVGPHMDFVSTKWATILRIYLVPEYRRGARGMKLLRLVHERLRVEGVKIVMVAHRLTHVTVRGRATKSLWEFAGYAPLETIYIKVLE